jgi:hypothetical protein
MRKRINRFVGIQFEIEKEKAMRWLRILPTDLENGSRNNNTSYSTPYSLIGSEFAKRTQHRNDRVKFLLYDKPPDGPPLFLLMSAGMG